MANDPILSIRGVSKTYANGPTALEAVDLDIQRGEIFALLGPNGAGKTTTVEILEGFHQADSGEVRVLGEDPWGGDRTHRDRIGIVLQETSVEEELQVDEAINIYGGIYPKRRDTGELL